MPNTLSPEPPLGVGFLEVLEYEKHSKLFSTLPGPPKVPCFSEVFCYIKPTKKHGIFGGPGSWCLCNNLNYSSQLGLTSFPKGGGFFQKIGILDLLFEEVFPKRP